MAHENPDDPWAGWRNRITASRARRDEDVAEWQTNVDKRKGGSRTTGASESLLGTTSPVRINKDHPLSKAKIALLYSRTPKVRTETQNQQATPFITQHAKDLNDVISKARVGASIEEELADVVNASGIAGVIVSCEKRMGMKDVPQFDPMVAAMSGMENPMIPTPYVADIRYPVRRISPASLLIPADFTGSVYDEARWLGYEGELPWATAKVEFQLTDEDKEAVLGATKRKTAQTTLNTDEATKNKDTDVVTFQELCYWRHHYHEEETDFFALQRLVFVDGKESPVVDEPYKGQQRGQDGKIVGVKRNPIQILTLTYISDDPFPPSDSSISRSQVTELEESREQMAQQRKHSIPIRWFNPNVVTPNTRALLEKGEFQGFVPIANGERGIGEVARASFPQEKFELDRVVNQEITDQWTVGPNQAGGFASGERSAREAGIVERNFQTRIGQERAKVEAHFLAIVEILGGLMALHGTGGLPPEVVNSIVYSIHADATVAQDADTQIDKLMKGLNLTAQSGYVNPKPVITKIWELLGEDPSQIVIDPQPKAPEPVKVSIGSAEDIINPLMLAALYATNQGPSPEHLAAAIKAIQTALAGGMALPPPPTTDGRPPREPETPGIANPGWEAAPRVERRSEDGGA